MIDKIMRPNWVYSACCLTAYIQHYMPASTKVATRYPPIAKSLELSVFGAISSLISIIFAQFVHFTLCHHGQVNANFAGRLTFFRRPQ